MKKISLFAITLLVAAGCSEEEYEGTMSGTTALSFRVNIRWYWLPVGWRL